LSAGQRRRTALACLLARRPELWLLDEPHAGLDQASRDQLDRLVRQAAQQGATVLFSSHEHERAAALADRSVDLIAGTNAAKLLTEPERGSLGESTLLGEEVAGVA
jgi:energy-coupling factor transporter ATP-binding protein EcfA2